MKKYSTQSRYYLYVKFKPGHGTSFTYNSDDSRGTQHGLRNLIRRVLQRSIVGKYDFAKLVDRDTRQVLQYYLGTGEQFSPEAWAARIQPTPTKAPELKGSVCFYQQELQLREKHGLPPLVTLQAKLKNEFGTGLSCALVNLRREAAKLAEDMPFRLVNIYQHPGNRRVARLLPDGIIRVTDKDFYEQVSTEGLIPAHILKITMDDRTDGHTDANGQY